MSDDPTQAAGFHAYLVAESSSGGKFWEARVDGAVMSLRYGKVGQTKSWTTKSFASGEAALKEARKKMKAKVSKGYAEAEVSEDGGAPVVPAGPQTFEERWAEIRSLLEGKANKATVAKVKRHYLEMHALEPKRLVDEVDTYLFDKLGELPATYFDVSLSFRGFNGYGDWKSAQPLRDVDALDKNPWVKFTRSITYGFDGAYMVDDTTEITEYHEKYWLQPAVPTWLWAKNPIFARVETLDIRLDQLSENQDYSCKTQLSDFTQMLFAAKALEHLRMDRVWDMNGGGDFGAAFASEDAPALESLSLSDAWIQRPEHVASIFEAERQKGLKSFTLGDANLTGDDLIGVLSADDAVVELEHLRCESGRLGASSGEALRTHRAFASLKVLEIGEPMDGFIEALCDPSGSRVLEELSLVNTKETYVFQLQKIERVAFKTLVIEPSWSAWSDERKEELEALGKSKKFKVKFPKKKR